MANRIDVTIPDADFQSMKALATQLNEYVSRYFPTYDPKNRPTGQGMGAGLPLMYVQKAFEILTADRTIVHPAKLDYTAFERDMKFAIQILDLKKALGGLTPVMDDCLVFVGFDLMEQANLVRSALDDLKGVSKDYADLFESLNFVYKQRAQKTEATLQHKAAEAELKQQIAQAAAAEKKE